MLSIVLNVLFQIIPDNATSKYKLILLYITVNAIETYIRGSFPKKRFLDKKKVTIIANPLIGSWDWHREMILWSSGSHLRQK